MRETPPVEEAADIGGPSGEAPRAYGIDVTILRK